MNNNCMLIAGVDPGLGVGVGTDRINDQWSLQVGRGGGGGRG